MSDSVRPHRRQPTRRPPPPRPVPGILQARTLEWVSFSHVRLFAPLWTIAHQVSLSMGFSRQEYWSELPCPPPGYCPHPRIEAVSPAAPALQVDSLPLSYWEAHCAYYIHTKHTVVSAAVIGNRGRSSWQLKDDWRNEGFSCLLQIAPGFEEHSAPNLGDGSWVALLCLPSQPGGLLSKC